MISDSAPAAQARSVAWLTAFVALLAILAFVVETLSQLGVPAKILVWLVAGFALAVPAGIAIAVRTISPGEFALAGRNVALGVNAAVSAIAAFGGVFSIAIAAAFFRSEGQMSALALGLCGGLVVGGILLAPYFRRSGSQTVGDFLAARFGSRLVSALAGLIVAVALFPMLVAQLHDRRHDRRLDARHRPSCRARHGGIADAAAAAARRHARRDGDRAGAVRACAGCVRGGRNLDLG